MLSTLLTIAAILSAVTAQSTSDCSGKRGFTSPSYGTIGFSGDAAQADFAPCKAYCQPLSAQSFAYGDGQCLCYGVPVAGIGSTPLVVESPTSPYSFYDISCTGPAAPTTTTSAVPVTTTSAAAPSTTTSAGPTTPQDCSGRRGYGIGATALYSNNPNDANFASCKSFCGLLAAKNAKSFGFGGTECLCYADQVATSVGENPASPFVFYDIGCDSPAPTTTSVAPVTTTTPAATTSATPTGPLDCTGKRGYGVGSTSFYSNDPGNANFASCKSYCSQPAANALSFGFGPTECLCYSTQVGTAIGANPASPYIFYDLGCTAPVTSTTPLATTPSTTPATTPSTTPVTTPSTTPVRTTTSTTLVTTTRTPSPTPVCFRAYGTNSRGLLSVNGKYLQSNQNDYVQFEPANKASLYVLDSANQLRVVLANGATSNAVRDSLPVGYGHVRTGIQGTKITCSISAANALNCRTSAGDRFYSFGNFLHLGKNAKSLYSPVDMAVVKAACPANLKF